MTKICIPCRPMLISVVLEVCVVSDVVYYKREMEDRGHGLVLALVPTTLQNAVTKYQDKHTIKNCSKARNHCRNGIYDRHKVLVFF